MLYMTVWAIKHRTFANNFAYETAEINIEVKHLQILRILRSMAQKFGDRICQCSFPHAGRENL